MALIIKFHNIYHFNISARDYPLSSLRSCLLMSVNSKVRSPPPSPPPDNDTIHAENKELL